MTKQQKETLEDRLNRLLHKSNKLEARIDAEIKDSAKKANLKCINYMTTGEISGYIDALAILGFIVRHEQDADGNERYTISKAERW